MIELFLVLGFIVFCCVTIYVFHRISRQNTNPLPQSSSFRRDPRLPGFNLNTHDFNIFRCPLGHQYETRYETHFCCPRCHQNYAHANHNVRVCIYNDPQCGISVCGNCIRRINNDADACAAAVNMPYLYRNPFACHQLFIQCGKFTEDMTPLTNGSYLLKLGENLHLFLDLQFEESDLCGHVGSLKILQGMDCDVENIKGFYGCKTSRLALCFTFNNEEIELRGTVHDQGEYVKGIFTYKGKNHQEKFTLHRIGFCATAGEGNDVGNKESEGDIPLSKLSRYQTCMELKERNITKISVKDAFDEKDNETKIFNTISEDNDCQICFDHAIDCVILPCGHLCMCSICGDKMKENPVCPICRTNIKHIMIPQ